MADFYTQYSVLVPCDHKRTTAWVEARNELIELHEDNPTDEGDQWFDEYVSGCEVDAEHNGLWVHDSDCYGDIQVACNVIEQFMKDHNIEGAILLQWADTCSKPRLDSFGGGGVIVTKDGCTEPVLTSDAMKDACMEGIQLVNA